MRLDKHLSLGLSASGTASHLRQKVKGAFGGAKIRQMKGDIGVHHTHKRHLREIKPLGDHLSANQDIQLTTGKGAVNAFMSAPHRGARHLTRRASAG